ncbi:hypothetical protein OIV83_004412 [Microbotryomycetes sp. JL201]|nr:hypothetical protein OIV83_004412 [Microbotryomycetes sp. JL201]
MALSTSNGALHEALKVLQNLPPNSNPYAVLAESLWIALVPDLPKSFELQMFALSGVFGLCFILVVASMVIQAVAGNFWLVRSRNGLWRPHWSLGWSSFALFLLLFLQVQVWTTWQWSHRVLVYGLVDFKLLPWQVLQSSARFTPRLKKLYNRIFSWIGGAVACWGLITSYILNTAGNSAISRPMTIMSNTFAILVPAMFLGALLPFWIRSSIKYRAFLSNFETLLVAMQVNSSKFTGKFSIVDLLPYGDLLGDMQDHLDAALVEVRKVFIVLAACSTGLVAALVTISSIQLTALTRALSRTKHLVTSLESTNSRDKALLRSYHNLKWTIISFSSIALCFIGICSYVAIKPRQSFTLKGPIEVTTLLPLYNIAIFGLPTAILLFTLSFEGWRLNRANNDGSAGGSGNGGATNARSGTSSYSGPDTSSWAQKLKNKACDSKKSSAPPRGLRAGGAGAQSISIMCAGQTLSQLNSPITPLGTTPRQDAFELDAFPFERHVTFPPGDGASEEMKV